MVEEEQNSLKKDGRKLLSIITIPKHLFGIFEDTSAPSRAPFSCKNVNNKKRVWETL